MLCLLDVSILFDGLRIECGASDVLRWFDTCGRRVEWTYCFDTLARHVRPTGVFDVLFVGCNYFLTAFVWRWRRVLSFWLSYDELEGFLG